MEKHKIRISSDTDNVSLDAFPDGIIINGQTISFNDVIALTNGSHTVRKKKKMPGIQCLIPAAF
jgi:hypothetical protein